MNRDLYTAAIEGNTDSLHSLIQQDPLLLDRRTALTAGCLETPLHVAALRGHDRFVAELLRAKPGLVCEVDWQGSSPLHLAAFKGHTGTVKELLAHGGSSMCFVRDKDGMNPIHVAAVMGRVDALNEMLRADPGAARAPVTHGGSVLHLCVEHSRLEALKLLLNSGVVNELLNSKDEYGNTVLHLCAINKQVKIMEFLLSVAGIEVNAKNLKGMTAMDILVQRRTDTRDSQMEEFLVHAGALQSKESATFVHIKRDAHGGSVIHPSRCHCMSIDMQRDVSKGKKVKDKADWLDKKQSAMMVVATLIASMAFQVGVNPPDAVWKNNNGDASALQSSDGVRYYLTVLYVYLRKYARFYMVNTIGFIASLSIIFLLMSGLPLKNRAVMWVLMVITWTAITATALTYTVMVILLTPDEHKKFSETVIGITVIVWIVLMALLLFGHTVRLLFKTVKGIFKLLWPRRRLSRISPKPSLRM